MTDNTYLREVAEAAAAEVGKPWADDEEIGGYLGGPDGTVYAISVAHRRHIIAFSPEVTLSLLDQIDESDKSEKTRRWWWR